MRMFDRMKDSISSVGTGVSQKVSYTTDTARLNSQIRNNDKEIEKLIYQVGLKCVQLHLDDTDSGYEELFTQIRSLQRANVEHQAEIQRLTEELETQEQIRQQEIKERQAQREQEYRKKEELKKQQREAAKKERVEMTRQAQQERQDAVQKGSEETTKLCQNCKQRSDVDSRFCVYCGMPFPESDELSREC